MSTGKPKRSYFFHCFLILCCLSFCVSGCPSNEITVSGEITCETCESGKTTVLVNDCSYNPIAEKTLDGCGAYSILIPSSYSGKSVAVAVRCDEDNDGEFSIGDHVGEEEWLELQQTNEVNLVINQEITATIEGEVSCNPYTDGLLYVYAFDGPRNEASPPSYIGGPLLPVKLNETASYKVLLCNTSPGSEVWLTGLWDKTGNGVCQGTEAVNDCDYAGGPASFILDNEEMTEIDFEACPYKIQPCLEETPQDNYAIDALPGSDTPPYELDEEILTGLVNLIEAGDFGNIHSLIIIHNDNLVLEEYFMGWTRHMRHLCASTTKSFTSALIGIAVDQGKLNGVDETLLSFFPEYSDIANPDERKESITLENVLTMSAGFTWNELSTPYGTPENDSSKMGRSSDWIKYMLDLPMSDNPGTKFVYNSGCTILLSGIIAKETGQSAEEFAKDNLFNALGITNREWQSGPNEISNTGWGLFLHPVNMAMFGYLYLKNGLLNGEQVVPEDWIKESTSKHIASYGYQWWILPNAIAEAHPGAAGAYYALGYGGQYIFVLPNLNMVVVATAENYGKHQGSAFTFLRDYIFPALKEK